MTLRNRYYKSLHGKYIDLPFLVACITSVDFIIFSPYFELFRRIDVFPIQTLIITITQCHVDGNQRAWATCGNRLTETSSLGLPFTSLILDIHVTINDTCQNKLSADQYHVTISRAQVCSSSRSHAVLKLTADQVLVFDWIAGSCHVNLLKTGQDCSEAC